MSLAKRETVAVDALEVVVRRAMPFKGHSVETHPHGALHLRGQMRGLGEEFARGALQRSIGVVHETRTRAQTPLAAPQVANHRPHGAPVTIIDTITLFCHNFYFKKETEYINH